MNSKIFIINIHTILFLGLKFKTIDMQEQFNKLVQVFIEEENLIN